MRIRDALPAWLLIGGLLGSPVLSAADRSLSVGDLQREWAHAKYLLPQEKRGAALEQLAAAARAAGEADPGRAEPLIWEAIILSTQAGEEGGLGALGLVKQARDRLLEAEKLDPEALNGSVYTSLGSLYYQVPGWPIGFGDDDKAEAYLKKALALNPDGIDPNYFYADYLLDEGQAEEAIRYFEQALKAAPRPGREIADRGRQGEIQAGLLKARKEAGGGSGF